MTTTALSANTPITFTIDTAALLQSLVRSGDYDEDGAPTGHRLSDQLVDLAADKLVRDVRKTVVEQVGTAVEARVNEIVRATLAEGVRKTDTWGQPTGEPMTMAQLIREEVQTFLTKREGDYRRSETRAEKIVREMVDQAVTKELRVAIGSARDEAAKRVKDKASEIIAETITRSAR